MFKSRFTLFTVLAIALISCDKDRHIKHYPEKIIGRWSLVHQKAFVNAYDENGKKDTTVADESRTGLKPPEFDYAGDSSLVIVFKNYYDKVLEKKLCKWRFDKDTIIVNQESGELLFKQRVAMTDSTMTFTEKLDWDYDGQDDDGYEALYKREVLQ